jgi:hypothetical protein
MHVYWKAGATITFCLVTASYLWLRTWSPKPRLFIDGDVVCFVGDSITQAGLFTTYVEIYYSTRFPDSRFEFYNCGISGGKVDGAVKRAGWDIMSHKPTVVSVLFGMNDIRRSLYSVTEDNGTLIERATAIRNYKGNLNNLTKLIKQRMKSDVILCSSTPYDELSVGSEKIIKGIDGALKKCAIATAQVARRNMSGFIDVHEALLESHKKSVNLTPPVSLISDDRIHPKPVGQLLLAFHYLKAQRVPSTVCESHLDVTRHSIRTENCKVVGLKVGGETIEFELLAQSLPIPILEPLSDAMRIVPFDEINREILSVNVNNSFRYKLAIDGTEVGEFSGSELQAGINIGFNPNTPQQRQSQRYLAALQQCQVEELRLRRYYQVKIMLEDSNIDPSNQEATEGYFQTYLSNPATANNDYFSTLFADFRNSRNRVPDLIAELSRSKRSLSALTKPVAHRYVFSRTR